MVPCMLSLSASLGVRVAIGRALAALGSPRACRASLSARPSPRKRREAVHLPLHRLLASLGEVGGLFTAGGVKRGALFTRGGAASAGFAVAVATGGGSSVSCSSERATVLGSPPKRASRGQAAVLPCSLRPWFQASLVAQGPSSGAAILASVFKDLIGRVNQSRSFPLLKSRLAQSKSSRLHVKHILLH